MKKDAAITSSFEAFGAQELKQYLEFVILDFTQVSDNLTTYHTPHCPDEEASRISVSKYDHLADSLSIIVKVKCDSYKLYDFPKSSELQGFIHTLRALGQLDEK